MESEFKFNGPTPEEIKQEEALARQRAVEEFVRRGGTVEELKGQETPRPNTAR